MDYSRFVRLRKPVWDGFEEQLAPGKQSAAGYDGLEAMALRYRQVLHDYALASSRFPGTAAARRLRGLAVEGTRRLTGDRGERRGLMGFLGRTFPRAFQRQLDLLGIALGLFLFAALWGLVLTVLRPALGLSILGPQALNGLEEGHLWTESLVTTVPPAFASSRIATNNLTVALMAWSGGVLAGLVPLYSILLNGLMLGAVFGVTLHYSMAGALLEFISAHGPLEITLILVCAAGGLNIGRALVAADDRPRALALRETGRDALAVLLGCLPWFVVLGVVEAFVSPAPQIPPPLKALLGLLLEGLFLSLAFRSVPEANR